MDENASVKAGAQLSCSLGTETCILQVPRNHGASCQGGNQAVISDNVPGFNIPGFCKCKRIRIPEPERYPPCVPNITIKWLKGQKDRILDDELVLLKKCILPCTHGGVIKIDKTGQRE